MSVFVLTILDQDGRTFTFNEGEGFRQAVVNEKLTEHNYKEFVEECFMEPFDDVVLSDFSTMKDTDGDIVTILVVGDSMPITLAGETSIGVPYLDVMFKASVIGPLFHLLNTYHEFGNGVELEEYFKVFNEDCRKVLEHIKNGDNPSLFKDLLKDLILYNGTKQEIINGYRSIKTESKDGTSPLGTLLDKIKGMCSCPSCTLEREHKKE